MGVFLPTLNQMGFLMLLIIIGYILVRVNAVQSEGTVLISRLENNVFVPALILNTFVNNFTVEKISEAWKFLVAGTVLILITAFLAVYISRFLTKDKYLQNIYTYGLAFANFGFMGNAVVLALFPDMFMNYIIFVLPLWVAIYAWAVPVLLIPNDNGKRSIKETLMAFLNPMFVSILIGAIIGLCRIQLPDFLLKSFSSLGDCMSPLAMILTGMTIAKIDLKKTFSNLSIYFVSLIRLIFIPLFVLLFLIFIPIDENIKLCAMCCVSMPLGLNTIVVPGAYGKDTSVAAGLALVSHLISCLTIPLIFMLFDLLI